MYHSYFAERAYRRVNFSMSTNTDDARVGLRAKFAEVRVNVGFAGRLSSATASRSATPNVDFMDGRTTRAGAGARLR
jgi:hypothetical protein